MKKIIYKIALVMFITLVNNVKAQSEEKTKFDLYYFNASAVKLNNDYLLKELGVNAITNKNWGLSSSYHNKVTQLQDLKFINRQSVSLRWNKLFDTNTDLVKYGFELGPIFNQSVFYNYKFDVKTKITTEEKMNLNSAGLFLRTKVEFPFFKNIGMQIGSTVIIDKAATGFTADLVFCFGKVRNEVKEKINVVQFLLN